MQHVYLPGAVTTTAALVFIVSLTTIQLDRRRSLIA
jgi:hypothetical protein